MYARQPFAVVENLTVQKGWRGNGIGHALRPEAERFCKESDCSKMILLSSTHCIHAHRFFEQAGFRAGRKRGLVKYCSQSSSWLFEVYRH
ncbi:GNAT family N-acetyltransferase [Paraburkholderia edwinii]|uniref:GNAT family N-acetyltransferase n=1 Tax=Paraburkholderia edwinii TaxID=2861782 RepID=UPI003CCEE977